jgi:anaerobic ribonucleoside-triphosphate reductase
MSEQEGEGEVKVACKVYSRIVGYLTAVDDWNAGKQAEFADRTAFDVTAHTEEHDEQ